MNIVELLLRTATTEPDRVAVRWHGRGDHPDGGPSGVETWTYGDLDAVSARYASALGDLGVQVGDRVVIQVEKIPETIALGLAIFRAGAVLVPLNVAYREDEVVQFLEDAAPTLAVASPATLETMGPAATRLGVTLRLLARPGDEVPAEAPSLLADAPQGTAAAKASGPTVSRRPDDLAALLYTSGTTGRSKGAMLSHGNLSSNGLALCELWQISRDDVLLHVLPVFHVHGLFVALHTVLMQGAQTLLCERFDVEEVVKLLPESTVFMAVPTLYSRLLAHEAFGREVTRNMRLFTSGSAPLSPDAHVAFEERTGHRILERYGMTEAGMITSNPYESGEGVVESIEGGPRVAGTVGFALPGVDVRICDDGGQEVESGEVGVLEVRGPNVFGGYWRRPESTDEAFREGWLISGDLATQSESGRVTLVGRAKDLIIVGGYNVYPPEIENLLTALPSVAEAAVIGVPHPDMGEGVLACLVASAGRDDDAVRSALERISSFKRPRRLEWLDELPRNAMGKVQKNVLRQRFARAYEAASD